MRFFPMEYFGLRSDKDGAGDVPLNVYWDNFNYKTGKASGYITTINDISRQDRVIENIMWRFKADNGAIKELKPTDGADIMLNGGRVSITVIVDGLDHEAKPIATVIN